MALHAFVVMPFGKNERIDFNKVYTLYIKPALESADFEVFRADEETRAGGNTVRVWDAKSGRELNHAIYGREVEGVTCDPGGRHVAAGSEAKATLVLAWQLEDLITKVCFRHLRNLPSEEWRQYLGDEPNHKICANLPAPEEYK